MKKTILLFAAALCCGTLLRAQDTLTVANPSSVTIISTPRSQTVEINGSAADHDYRYTTTMEAGPNAIVRTREHLSNGGLDLSVPLFGTEEPACGKTRKSHGEVDLAVDFGFGICFPSKLDDAAYDPMRQAWGLDFTMSLIQADWHPWGGKSHFWAMFGLEDKSFKIRGDEKYVKNDDGTLGFLPFAPDTPKWSALRIFSWNIGVGYTQHIYQNVSLTVGPVVNFNTGSRIKTKWYDANGEKHKEKTKFGHQNLVTYELMGQLNIGQLGVYVKYNPCNLIDKKFGPDFATWSVGIVL